MTALDTLSNAQFVDPIRAHEARGDSRPVSGQEFQSLAARGKAYMDALAAAPGSTKGLDKKWGEVKDQAYEATREPWGGATVNGRTGKAVNPRANVYAITAKQPGQETISVPLNASREDFHGAMDRAREQFPQLAHKGHHLGIFHDADEGRIDIDPTVIVNSRRRVDEVGAATHAIGGAYHFRSGNGFWPPHVAD